MDLLAVTRRLNVATIHTCPSYGRYNEQLVQLRCLSPSTVPRLHETMAAPQLFEEYDIIFAGGQSFHCISPGSRPFC